MEKNKFVVILIVCFAFLGFILGGAFAEEIKITITGGVYRMITSPVLPENPDPQVSLADNLGPYDQTQWRFFRYNPARGDYDELKSPDWSPIEDDFYFGRGYWIISRDTKTIDIQGDPIGLNQITLRSGQDGWNQIGNIYLQDFMIGIFPNCNLWVIPESGGTWYQLNDPDNPYTQVTFQEYVGGEPPYIDIGDEPGEILETKKAYWLKNKWPEEVVLFFNPAGLTQVANPNSTDLPSEDFLARVAQQEAPPDPPLGLESSSSGSGSGSGGCFIATAAYGDYDNPMVQLMREFRDRYLLSSSFGRFFVDMYYRYSPALARFVADSKPSKILIRFGLMPVVATSAIVSEMNVYGLLIVLAFPFLGSFVSLRRRKGAWGECKPTFSGKMREQKIRE
jgi:hypothetical protein